MVYVSDNSISGQFGLVVALTGTSTTFTAAGLQSIYNLPRSQKIYPQNQLFKIFDRTKKVLDQTKLPSQFTVLNNAVAVAGTNWSLLYGGYVLFNAPQTAAGGTANEVQTLTSTMTGGSFAATFDDGTGNPQKTGPIAWNVTGATFATNIATALNALSNIGAAGVVVTGTGPFTVTFSGTALANNPYAVLTIDNTLATGGTMVASEATPGTSGFTMSGNYIPTNLAANVVTIPETKDWKMVKNAAVVKNDVYGTGFSRSVSGIADGTFDFMQNGVDNTLYDYQFNGAPIHLALYESTKSSPPRIWLVGGFITATPLDNTVAGMLSGQVTGTLIQWPTLIRETL